MGSADFLYLNPTLFVDASELKIFHLTRVLSYYANRLKIMRDKTKSNLLSYLYLTLDNNC